MSLINRIETELDLKGTLKWQGQVSSIKGQSILAKLPQAAVGDLCYITAKDGSQIAAQVVAFDESYCSISPFASTQGIPPGAVVKNSGETIRLKLPPRLAGNIFDALGKPLGNNQLDLSHSVTLPLYNNPPDTLRRKRITKTMRTGVRSIDELCTIGYGQRLGLFASAGVGKSTLLGMIARNADVDVVVIALVGERGREVNEFLEDALGPAGLKRSVVVVATSDEPSIRRAIAPHTATAIAEYYRSLGKRVLLLIDSLTRMARAVREVSISAGELPVRQGYTNTVYTELPRLVERAGMSEQGSITAIYTVLTEVNADFDPLGDEIKSLLDGHIVLSNDIVRQGIRPAIDVTQSVSRLMTRLHSTDELSKRELLIQVLARLKRDRDLILLGATPDRELSAALKIQSELISFLKQTSNEIIDPLASTATIDKLLEVHQKELQKHSAANTAP